MPAAVSARSGEVVQDWVLEQCIGSGSFATVWKAHKHASESSVAAIKIISTDKLSTKLKQSLECEVSILKQISHGNIVKLYEVVEAHNRLHLVMEYCGGGDLAEYIRRNQRVRETVAKGLLQQLASGLQELWRHHFVHRDLKPQNLLLLDTTSAPTVKIADFGFARDLQPQGLADTLCGSPLYMAPEILQFHKYDAKADLWSVGIILYELVVGRTPFDGGNHVQLLRNIERSEARVPDPIARSLSPHCIGLISQLLKRNPVERISFEEFFAHPFLLPGEALPPPPVREPFAPQVALTLPAGALPTIASGIVLPLEGSSLPEEGHLPFSVDVEQRAVGERNSLGRGPVRVASVPSSPVTRPPVVMTAIQAQQRHQCCEGLRTDGHMPGISSPRAKHLQDSLDEDDYVIIERSPSSSAAGSKVCAQSLSTARPSFQPLQPPPPTTVPLLVGQPEGLPHAAGSCCLPLSDSLGEIHFTAGLPRFEALRRVACLLEDLAAAKQHHSAYADALAFRLLALQVLSIVTEAMEQDSEAPESTRALADDVALCAASDLAACMHMIADRAEQVGMALQAHAGSIQQALPDVWELVYQAALAFSKAAAVDELLASHLASLRSYAKAGALFYFMLVDGKVLPLEPKLHLSQADQRRLQRFTACVALRHQGCLAHLSTSSASRQAEIHPCPTDREAARLGAPNLQASLSAHPPLQDQAAV